MIIYGRLAILDFKIVSWDLGVLKINGGGGRREGCLYVFRMAFRSILNNKDQK